MRNEEWLLKQNKEDAGTLYWRDTLIDESGSRITRELFQGIIKQLCLQSYDHWLMFNDYYPLTELERNWYSHFSSAVHSITKYHLSEHSVSRKSKGSDQKNGRADLWANHKDRNFLFELKRETIGFKNELPSKRLEKATSSVFRQALSLKKEVREDWYGNSTLLGLCVVVPFSSSEKLTSYTVEDGESAVQRFLYSYTDKISVNSSLDSPNIIAAWSPPFKAQQFEFDRNKKSKKVIVNEYIPYIGFVAKAFQVAKK